MFTFGKISRLIHEEREKKLHARTDTYTHTHTHIHKKNVIERESIAHCV